MKKYLFTLLIGWGVGAGASAQIPFEVFAGEEKTSLDLMFFRFFKNREEQNSKTLFFSRQRAVMDYADDRFPQFGFTQALSYNHPALKGIAPVFVGKVFNRGAFAKAGVQYVHLTRSMTIFGWSVAELRARPVWDVFLMLRYTPRLWSNWEMFSQLELINALPSDRTAAFSFAQRLRLGLKLRSWQFGLGGDLAWTGRQSYAFSRNTGLFLRHEF